MISSFPHDQHDPLFAKRPEPFEHLGNEIPLTRGLAEYLLNLVSIRHTHAQYLRLCRNFTLIRYLQLEVSSGALVGIREAKLGFPLLMHLPGEEIIE